MRNPYSVHFNEFYQWLLALWRKRICRIFLGIYGVFAFVIPIYSQNITDIYAELKIQPQLSIDDAKIYKRLFDGINAPRPPTFDKDINALKNKSLIPTIYYARYTSAQSAGYQQLCDFMAKYPDYPDAIVIYKLALKKKPKAAKCNLQAPIKSYLDPDILIDFRPNFESTGVEGGILEDMHNRKILGLLKEKKFNQALAYIRSIANQVKPENLGLYYANIIQRFYREGHYESAIDFTVESFRFAPKNSYIASWWAGLAAWQLEQHEVSYKFFEQTMASDDKWLAAGAAFWVGRNLTRLGEVENVNAYFAHALNTAPFSFYGQLAAEILGENYTANSKNSPNFNAAHFEKMYKNPTIKRIFALCELNRFDDANRELRPIIGRLTSESAENLLFFMNKLNVNFASLKLAEHLERVSQQVFVDSLFPLQPNLIDSKAPLSPLVYGVIRQESAFITHAKSPVGAIGLMQVMPGTANLVAQKPLKRNEVADPKTNVGLGTKYLNQLLNLKDVEGNIFYSLAGYNAGIGNVRRWGDVMPNSNDPLIYIESIPIRETRIYLERVMANYWVYSNLLNADLSSRKDIAEGRMPKLILNQLSQNKP